MSTQKFKVCDCENCDQPARFQVGFIAPLKRVVLMPESLNKDYQMWLALGVCGSCREKIKTISDLLTEDQMNMTNANMAKVAKPTVDFAAGFVMFSEVINGKADPKRVTRADGKPFGRAYKQASAIIKP